MQGSILLIADILFLSGVKGQIADRSNQAVDAEGDRGQEEVSAGSAGETLRFQGRVIDDQAADPTQEEGQQKTNEILIHFLFSFLLELLSV